jgi:hypothetical protein
MEVIEMTKTNTNTIVDIDIDDMDDIIVDATNNEPQNTAIAPELTAELITPKMLDEMFKFGDSGRTVRRYLRKYFAANHLKKTSWNLTKSESLEVIAFLNTKYGVKA